MIPQTKLYQKRIIFLERNYYFYFFDIFVCEKNKLLKIFQYLFFSDASFKIDK
jgi:hypothetical protein